jgi:beta-lactamase class A
VWLGIVSVLVVALVLLSILVIVRLNGAHMLPRTDSSRISARQGRVPMRSPTPSAASTGTLQAPAGGSLSSGTPFSAAQPYLATRDGDVTAAVYDIDTGKDWVLQPGESQATASIVKVDIMATLLAKLTTTAEQLSATDKSLLTSMIEESDNDAATALWNEIGAPNALAASNESMGMTQTVASSCLTCPGFSWPGWGLTTTTASDQITLLKQLVLPNDHISDGFRQLALNLLENVTPSEQWGITGGVPAGVTVALKNGWVPLQDGLWQINSIGWVSGDNRNYLIAVLTDGNPTEQYGIDTINSLSSDIWTAMATEH